MSRRTRLLLLAIIATIAALGVAAFIALYVLMQPQRVTEMLRKQARQAGMQLTLSTPAQPTLWPRPALVLHGLTLSMDNRPVLVAARSRLVLPWSTLFGGPAAISRLELDTPQINLAQLGPAFANMQADDSSGTPSLLRIKTGIVISNGSIVRGGEILLSHLHLETGPLTPGQVFRLDINARSERAQPVKLSLRVTPEQHGNTLRLQNIQLAAAIKPILKASMHGSLVWQANGSIGMSLTGELVHQTQHHYEFTLQLQPTAAHDPMLFHVTVKGQGVSAALALSPTQLSHWWQQINRTDGSVGLPLPPIQGKVQASELKLGNVRIKGLEITTEAPAQASSTPAPATTTTP